MGVYFKFSPVGGGHQPGQLAAGGVPTAHKQQLFDLFICHGLHKFSQINPCTSQSEVSVKPACPVGRSVAKNIFVIVVIILF